MSENNTVKSEKSEGLFRRAVECIPGGVNSPVRAYRSVGMTPRFIASARGDRIFDEDGNEYIDFVGSWGPMILGHSDPDVLAEVERAMYQGLSFGAATEREVDMAELICSMVPSIEMVRMVNSGTEAVMSAIRTARGFTGKDKIIKFSGCYHGHSDSMLVKAGSGVMTQGIPDSAGVPAGCTKDTLTAAYNDLNSVEDLLKENRDLVAAVIVEPVAANMGVIPPNPGFLEGLRSLCDRYDVLLIFDEVITGFRLQADGAQGYFGVRPDLTTFGKIIGGGMPVGAYGGRREIMEMVAPAGPVYQAGTLSGNPVAMAAGMAQLKRMKDHPELYRKLNAMSDWFFGELQRIVDENYAPGRNADMETAASRTGCRVNHIGSLGSIFFTNQAVTDYTSAKTSDTGRFADYFRYLISNGVYVAPSQFEAMFLGISHTREDLEKVLEVIRCFAKQAKREDAGQ